MPDIFSYKLEVSTVRGGSWTPFTVFNCYSVKSELIDRIAKLNHSHHGIIKFRVNDLEWTGEDLGIRVHNLDKLTDDYFDNREEAKGFIMEHGLEIDFERLNGDEYVFCVYDPDFDPLDYDPSA